MLPLNCTSSLATVTRPPSRPRQALASLAACLLTAAAAMLATSSPAFAQCPLSIAPAVNYTVGTNPRSVAAADFNGDGRPDLAVANSFNGTGGNSVSILLGTGTGTFGAATNFAVGLGPISVAVGDFNADGRPDLAVANSNSGNVSILLGNANGTFAAAVNYAAGVNPISVAVGDFNGDGKPDLAVANFTSNNVSILLGTGTGAFGVRANFAVGTGPLSVAVGDFNGDGRPDLAVANNSSGNVSILLGTGTGAFAAATNFAVGFGSFSVAVGDFNGDGRPDLAVVTEGGSRMSILPGNADGTLAAAVNYTVGNNPFSVAVGDFNADGKPDLAVANYDDNNVSVLSNTAPGYPPPTFTQQPSSQVVQSGTPAAFNAAANGFGNTLTYQWRRNGSPMANGGAVSGTTTPSLTINPALVGDMAAYDLVVTSPSACGGAATVSTSAVAVLAVTPAPLGISNDNCSNAQRIGDSSSLTFSTIGATTDGPSEANLGFCCGDLQVNSDVWFIFQATYTGTATASLCGSNYDSKVAIYTGTTCPAAPNTALAGNDDAPACGGNGVQSRATFPCTAGSQYLIRVGGFSTSVGTAQLVVTSTPVPTCFSDLAGGGLDGLSPDGTVDGSDFIAFINAFAAGC